MSKPLNVLQFICPTGFYGAERWVLALGNNIDDARINCELLVTREPGMGELEIVGKYREIDKPCHIIDMNGRFDYSVVGKIVELIKARNIEIIHTHGYKSDIIGIRAAKIAGIKSVCTPHGFENDMDLKLRVFIWLGCQCFRFFDKVVPLSKQLLDDIKRFGIKPDRSLYIQNGVDLKEVEQVRSTMETKASEPIAKNREKFRLGYIGQLIGRKNISDMIEVFGLLHEKMSNIELYILGDGEDAEQLKTQASSLSCSDDIHFLGFRDDRLELLASFDLFVMTSSLEGIPRCLMEAMAMGVPIAAYDIPGVDQLIRDEETGFSATFGDKNALLNCWYKTLSDAELRLKVSEKANTFVYEKFSAQRMAKEYSELFEQMLHV